MPIGWGRCIAIGPPDGPTGLSLDPSFEPPAIQNAEGGNAIERGFHSAGSGSFLRGLGRVEPEVDARSHEVAQFDVVVGEVHAFDAVCEAFLCMDDSSDDVFSDFVAGMGLSCVNDLDFADDVVDAEQAFEVIVEHVRAFVGGSSSGETDGEDFRIKFDAADGLDVVDERVLRLLVRCPNLVTRDGGGCSQCVVVFTP